MNRESKTPIIRDPWESLRSFTDARIALGRTGAAIPLSASLDLKLAHAHARDAVHSLLDEAALEESLRLAGIPCLHLESMAASREDYLKRPDLGRKLNEASAGQLADSDADFCEVAIVLADGLSAGAVNKHAIPVLQLLLPELKRTGISIGPVSMVQNGRVAIGDEIGNRLGAKLMLLFIGERPGLSAPESMGAYISFAPRPGLTDDARNCVSNIRPDGLDYPQAVATLAFLVREALLRKVSGILLKERLIG